MGKFPQKGGYDARGGQDRPPRQMFQATCNKCGDQCEVPFRPTGERPIYCKNCFRRDEGPQSRPFGGRDQGRPSFGDKRMFEATCNRCGNRCEVPFRPTGEKPVYCRECFGKGGVVGRVTGAYSEQFAALSVKLDKILKLLGAPAEEESAKPESAASPAGEISLDQLKPEKKAKKGEGKKAAKKAKKKE